MRTETLVITLATILGVQFTTLAEDADPKGKAVADTLHGGMKAANLVGIKFTAEREIYAMKDKLIQSLKGAPYGSGILFDVQIFEHPEGGLWPSGPLRLGIGPKLYDVVMQSEQHVREHGRISNLPPSGYSFSKTKSYMLWATLEGKTLKVRSMTPENRELLYTTVENRLREQPKPEIKGPK